MSPSSLAHPVVEALEKNVVGVLLDGESGVFQKAKIFDQHRIIQVDEDAGALTLLGFKDRAQEAG